VDATAPVTVPSTELENVGKNTALAHPIKQPLYDNNPFAYEEEVLLLIVQDDDDDTVQQLYLAVT
jgi:hypothetical protein